MLATLAALVPVFLVIAFGYALFQSRLVGEAMWSAYEHLCFYILFPFLIVRTLTMADLSHVPVLDFATVVVSAVLGMGAMLLAIRPLLVRAYGLSGPRFTSLFQGATRWHGFVALSMAGPLFGDDGVTLVAIAIGVMVPVIQVLNVSVLVMFGASPANPDAKPSVGYVLYQLARNPFFLACLIGGVCNQTGLPDIALRTLDIIGSGGLGIGLLTVGAGLRIREVQASGGLVAAAVAVRLAGMPALMLLAAWAVGLDGLPRTVAVLAGSVPTAATSYVMARKMGGDAPLMASIITVQVIVAAITLPLAIWFAQTT